MDSAAVPHKGSKEVWRLKLTNLVVTALEAALAAHAPKFAMKEPEEIGSVVVAWVWPFQDPLIFVARQTNGSGDRRWVSTAGSLPWCDLTAPRPATPEERRTGIVRKPEPQPEPAQPVMATRHPRWSSAMGILAGKRGGKER